MDTIEIHDVSQFADQVGSEFRIEVGEDQFITATLTEATALNTSATGAGQLSREPFSLLFETGDDTVLQQQIYRVAHEKLGEFSLFLVPVGPGQLEAVFN